ncbi:UNVERIFIED_CONTAM: hypothetical protein GTU68_062090 [Idotea baltica]|nr:hypothetical protein [Idotea baltica]
MVDVSEKEITVREARAEAYICMRTDTLHMIFNGKHPKGDVLAIARIAGIQAAKKTSDLIPLCHPVFLSQVKISLTKVDENRIAVHAYCKLSGQTGVEMEALTAVSVASLTLYDMCKAVDRGMKIENIQLLEKKGGKSGHWKIEEMV